GSIEQDADVVMFVYRDEYYLAREITADMSGDHKKRQLLERTQNTAECIIGKQRHGPIGTVYLSFIGEFTKFGNLDEMTKQQLSAMGSHE
ncbi:MAG: replicative helicase, partial [Alphaproteobacteria bacterium]|nr:replicative helicase [Alphaproteobacteria bacterium]